MTVTPSAALADMESVAIAGVRFPVNAGLYIAECVPGPVDTTSCDLGTLESATTTTTGSFALRGYVRRVITTPTSGRVDCARAAGACRLVAAESAQYSVNATIPLSFNPKAPPPPAPQVTAMPSTGLVDHQVVHVTGSGMVPSSRIQVIECLSGTPGPSTCELDNAEITTSDASGRFSANWAVHRMVHPIGAASRTTTFDCASRADSCAIVAGSVEVHGSDAISFG